MSPGSGIRYRSFPLEYSDAAKMAKLLDTVFKPARKNKKGSPEETVKLVADERTNTLVLFASEDDTIKIKNLIALLDKEIPRGKENIRVYYLEHATAEDLVKVLQELPKKGSPDAAKGKKEAPVISDKVMITADKATNSLIITADKDDYLVIEEVIKKLDIPRSMVYIESLDPWK